MKVEITKRSNGYKNWNFEDGIFVQEVDFDGDLHELEVFNGDEYLGTVTPPDVEDMEKCINDLDNGSNPITDNWEDGMGNSCTLDGWGEKE